MCTEKRCGNGSLGEEQVRGQKNFDVLATAPLSQDTVTSQLRNAGTAGAITTSKLPLAGSAKLRLTSSDEYEHCEATPLWSVI